MRTHTSILALLLLSACAARGVDPGEGPDDPGSPDLGPQEPGRCPGTGT